MKARHFASLLSEGIQTALAANMLNPDKQALEFLAWFNHSLLHTSINTQWNLLTDETKILGVEDISDQLLQDIIKKAKTSPNSEITFADTSSMLTQALPSGELDLIMLLMSSSSLPILRLHSHFHCTLTKTLS